MNIPSATNSFQTLRIAGWRQFEHVRLDIHPRLTIITGANGSGKSTLLNIFSTHFGWNRPLLGTPRRRADGSYDYGIGTFKSLISRMKDFFSTSNNPHQTTVGSLLYMNGIESSLVVPGYSAAQYNLEIPQQQNVPGMHVDSYRPSPRYQPVPNIQMGNISAITAYNQYHSELMNLFGGGYSQYSPIFRMKEALITLALFGEGNKHIPENETLKSLFLGFNELLRRFLPESIGFEEISIRIPDVVLITKSGNFMIDASSGGLMALVDLAWRIYMFSQDKRNYVVTMDEPENHLHPSMQRTLMQRLISAFPGAQFIVATHSPFIVSAVKDSAVYVLKYGKDRSIEQDGFTAHYGRRVLSERLDAVNKAGTAGDILREVLGVSVTMPEWVEDDISSILEKYRGRAIDLNLLSQLRSDLNNVGFGEYYSSALSGLMAGQ